MDIVHFTFLSSDKKTNIHAIKWIPKSNKPSKILQISHGMIDYLERYSPFAQYLVMDNFLVVGNDHLGHGDSIKTKNDLGYFGEPNPSDLVVEDMHKLRKIIQNEYKAIPYFMLGHNMGSYLLRKYLSLHTHGLKGAIIMGTGYENSCSTWMKMQIIKLMGCFRGWHHRSQVMGKFAMRGVYENNNSTGDKIANKWLTKDKKIVDEYNKDPKCQFSFTLNGFLGLLETVNYSCKEENIRKISKKLPIFIVSGNNDPIGDYGSGVKTLKDMMENAGIKDVRMKLYKNDKHEILNETDKDTIYEDIKEWININSMKNQNRVVL